MDLRDQHRAAARAFIDALAADQRDGACFALTDGRRTEWTYLPGERPGVALADLDRRASVAAFRLIAAGLSPTAFAQAAAIMALEDVLDVVEGGGLDRHRGDYWLAVFGDPADDAWGWRVGGHHVSVNATWTPDGLRLTPLFLGANPARTVSHGRVVSAPLEPEESLAFDLVGALDGDARSRAVFSEEAPSDIVTKDASRVDGQPEPTGVPIDRLDGVAGRIAAELIGVYLDRFPEGCRRPPGDDLRFAWAGGTEPGTPHYYRIQGVRLLIELDNTQNGANHVHSVVRDLDADFGFDALADHLRHDHE